MDCRTMIALCLAALLAVLIVYAEGRNKKVIIHVPYKVKKIKHTHTVYKTVHHHHTHHDHEHIIGASDDHDHYRHMHMHDEAPVAAHSHPVVGIGIPEFLPDGPLDIPDVPAHDIPGIPNRHVVPLYRRN